MRNHKDNIERYLRGELSAAEMHALEREALDDPFLAEALEGVEETGRDNFLYDLHGLNKSIHERARSRKRKHIQMWGWTVGLAATVLLVAASGFLVVSLLQDQRAQKRAMEDSAELLRQASEPKDTLVIPLYKPAPLIASREGGARDQEVPPGGLHNPRAIVGRDADSALSEAAEITTAQPLADEPDIEVADQPAAVVTAPRQPVLADAGEQAREAKATRETGHNEAKKQIIIGKSAPQASGTTAAGDVAQTGKVISADSGTGMPGVRVTIEGTNKGTVTDNEGNFHITAPAQSALVFTFIGYEPQTVKIGDPRPLIVSLKEDVIALSETVVVGYGEARTTATSRAAEPEGGDRNFKRYLNTAVRYPEAALRNRVGGRVTVRFAIEPDGRLTGFEVLKGIGYGCDEALVDAIKNGPAWKPATSAGKPIRDTVKVRYNFQLP